MKSTFQNIASEKGRPADEPGAKGMGIDRHDGNPSRLDYRVNRMETSLGKNAGSSSRSQAGTSSGQKRGSIPGINPGNSSTLPKLRKREVLEASQAIVLRFPIKEAAELQDATTKAVESQRNGDSAMSLQAAANLSRGSVKARAEFAKLFGFPEHYGDPDFLAAWEGFAAFYERKKRQAEDGPADACDDAMGDLFGGTLQ